MKKSVIIIVVILLIAAILLLIAVLSPVAMLFYSTAKSYPLNIHHSPENVVRIELIYNDDEQKNVLHTISDKEVGGFMESLLEVDCHKHLSPKGEYGILIVRIYYNNGDIENVGSSACGYKSSEIFDFDGWYYADYDDLYILFSEYVDEKLLPNI